MHDTVCHMLREEAAWAWLLWLVVSFPVVMWQVVKLADRLGTWLVGRIAAWSMRKTMAWLEQQNRESVGLEEPTLGPKFRARAAHLTLTKKE